MIKRVLVVTIMAILFTSFFATSASAQLGKAQSNLQAALGGTGLESDLDVSIGMVIKGLLSLVGTIFLILTIYAGILWMTAQGNDEKVTKAKNILQSAIIGLVITMAAYAITSFVTGSLGGGSPTTQQQQTAQQQLQQLQQQQQQQLQQQDVNDFFNQ